MKNSVSTNKTFSHFFSSEKFEDVDQRKSLKNIKNDNKKRRESVKISLGDGITYKSINNNKFFFHIPSMELLLLKEIKLNSSKGLNQKISSWKREFSSNDNYLKIYDYLVNIPEGYITIVLEQPLGETLGEIINSIGFLSNSFINKIANNIIDIIKINIALQKQKNIDKLFCLCDVFFDIHEKVKMFPNIFSYFNDKSKRCLCKEILFKIRQKFSIEINPFFSLGYILLKGISGNLPLLTLDKILKQEFKVNSKKCCLLHQIISTEAIEINNSKNIILQNLLKLYPPSLEEFLCQCLSFQYNDKSLLSIISTNWLREQDIQFDRTKISMREIFKVVKPEKRSDVINQNLAEFIHIFSIIYDNLLLNNENYIIGEREYFIKLSHKKKVLIMLSYSFNMDMEEFIEIITKKLFEKSSLGNLSKNKEMCLNGSDNPIETKNNDII